VKLNGWDHALKVTADGTGLIGHAGAILLRKAADQAGLTDWLSEALREKGTSPAFDRGTVRSASCRPTTSSSAAVSAAAHDPQGRDQERGQARQALMANHHSLGPPGGPRRVDDVGRVGGQQWRDTVRRVPGSTGR